jgi:hypothetical protein
MSSSMVLYRQMERKMIYYFILPIMTLLATGNLNAKECEKMNCEISLEKGKTQAYLNDIRKLKALKKFILEIKFETFSSKDYLERIISEIDLNERILGGKVGEELYKQIGE